MTTDHAAALAEALEPFVSGATHTTVFLTSREKMHPAGRDLYADDVFRASLTLAAYHASREKG